MPSASARSASAAPIQARANPAGSAPGVPGAAPAAPVRYDGRTAGGEVTVRVTVENGQAEAFLHNADKGIETWVHGTAADGALLEDVASQQKSFIALLAGVAIDRKLLDLSKPVSFYAKPGWSKAAPAQEVRITVLGSMWHAGVHFLFSTLEEVGRKTG